MSGEARHRTSRTRMDRNDWTAAICGGLAVAMFVSCGFLIWGWPW